MKVEIHTQHASNAIVYEDAIGTYQKQDMYCVMIMERGERRVHKYPVMNLFRVAEDYPVRSHGDRA